MAYDEGLAERIRGLLGDRPGVSERRMFGGIAFLVQGHMSVGIVQDKLMVRVGPESYDRVLRERHARRMDFTGRPMKGFVFVLADGYDADADLERWVDLGVSFAISLRGKPSRSKSAPLNGTTVRRRGPRSRSEVPTRASMARARDLRCPSCQRWYALDEVFENCTRARLGIGSSPKGQWLGFRCKRCRVHSSVVLGAAAITIGDIDGAPGPCFIPSGRMSVSYRLKRDNAGITIQYGGREWRFTWR